MNGRRYLADTNAFIYLLQKKTALVPLLNSDWYFSFITQIELLGKPRITQKEISKLKQVLSVAKHTDAINDKAVALRQRYAIKTPDAIIGATAWQFNLPLITADVGFSKVKEVDIFLLDLS